MERLNVLKIKYHSNFPKDGSGLILEQFAMCLDESVLEDIPRGISFQKEKVLFH